MSDTRRDHPDDFDALLDALADGVISDERFAELQRLVRDDAALRRRYIEHVSLCADLHGVADETNIIEAEPIPVAKLAPADPVDVSHERDLSGRGVYRLFRYAAVACLIIAALVTGSLLWRSGDGAPRTTVRGDEANVTTTEPVATLIGFDEAVWSDGADVLALGDMIETGRLKLGSGSVELMTRLTATITFVGPGELEMLGPDRCRLHVGRLVATAPPMAKGFTVHTPRGDVVDLGTRFGVEVHEMGVTEVHVIDGRVRIDLPADDHPDAAPGLATELHAGQAIRLTAPSDNAAAAGAIAFNPARYPGVEPRPLTIAYRVPAGVVGVQTDFDQRLGHDFVVERPILVTRLGVFDSAADGLHRTLTAELWRRDPGKRLDAPGDDRGLDVIASRTFTPDEPGTLVGSSRFKPLPSPLLLQPGHYTVTAHGYGPGEPNCSLTYQTDKSWTTDSGDGAIRFVGGSRYQWSSDGFPTRVDKGPADRYAAGTFEFRAVNAHDQPTAASSSDNTAKD